ncbi:methyltransferase [Caballeronia sp. NK8]|uniref:class I SAM-dependent methyltransferase n=1 Tax=Caballeronia sp. NK8 TaxID=140098 RepID=UPI001BB77448|nr:class I SAM-dependent methyltransferase [Caballeronia sp. NK8]BCQ24031.1 methyltransferase [Caballeronia sp. NK8]
MDRTEIYQSIESGASSGDVFAALRKLPVDAVADALLYIPPEYSKAREALPRMATDEVQDSWTGSHGYPLLLQSAAFVRVLENGYRRYANRSLDDARILDYGCGWGRLLRLMYKFTAPENLHGCDPWDRSIALCRESGLAANLIQSAYIPTEPPFPGERFDLIYAFSVFTHLSARSGKAVMDVCRRSIADNGLMVITIRPQSYWEIHDQKQNIVDVKAMQRDHAVNGFAYTPHGREPIDGDITYGDTSMTLDYIRENWKGWNVAGVEFNLQDAYQTIVFLRPV